MINEFIEFYKSKLDLWFDLQSNPSLSAELGVDQISLAHLSESDTIYVTLPHSSPNIFGKRNLPAVSASEFTAKESSAHHLRIFLTHNNFSDLGWRPYSMWYITNDRKVDEFRYVTRGKKYKHRCVESLKYIPFDDIDKSLGPTELEIEEFRRLGMNMAASFICGVAKEESLFGINIKKRTTYVPLPILTSFVLEKLHGGEHDYLESMLVDSIYKKINKLGILEECGIDEAYIFDNYTNIAITSIFNNTIVIGGSKMKSYWENVEKLIHPYHEIRNNIQAIDISDKVLPNLFNPSNIIKNQLDEKGIEFSLGMALHEKNNLQNI